MSDEPYGAPIRINGRVMPVALAVNLNSVEEEAITVVTPVSRSLDPVHANARMIEDVGTCTRKVLHSMSPDEAEALGLELQRAAAVWRAAHGERSPSITRGIES